MSVHFVQVTKSAKKENAGLVATLKGLRSSNKPDQDLILSNVSLTLPQGSIISVEGGNNDHRLLLLKLINGSARPDRGKILSRGVRVSPVLNHGGVAGTLLVPGLTVRENIAFQAQLSHVPTKLILDFVVSASDCKKQLDSLARTLNWRQRWAIETVLFAAIPYDYYLIDRFETVPNFAQVQLYFAAQRRNATLIFATNQPNLTAQFRETALVMESGSVTFRHSGAAAKSGD